MLNPRRLEEAREWLRYAADDLEAAGLLVTTSTPKPKQCLFHAQQGAEKSMKALLVAHDRPYPLTHSLAVLLDLCSQVDEDFDPIARPCVWLTQFAVRFRYPGDVEEPSVGIAREGLSAAQAVHTAVMKRLRHDG